MDEDLGRIQELSKMYGSNCRIQMKCGALGEDSWKGFAMPPLHLAASYRRVKSMQSLLSAGADPETRDRLGQTTLHLLVTNWPIVLTTKPGSAAGTAAYTQAEACLRLLCEHGASVNAEVEGESHQTALHLSVRHAALSAVHILTSYGAAANAADSSGMTPLHMAAGILRKDMIASLIAGGADPNMGVKQSGNRPLHMAVVALAMKNNKSLSDGKGCIRELLQHGAEVDALNKAGITPLHEACSMASKELVDLLLSHGADINKPSEAGESCLFLFLNRRQNVRNGSLLLKLFSLTYPVTVYNNEGHLPSTLMLPCFFKQRDQLLELIMQPRRLQDICKVAIYLKHNPDKREELRKILPEKVYDFVFHYWENVQISF
ncbi:ankyrin repeat domain-containing protein 61-like [Brachionichthys hirsutus]|uniref:ankyrin repeat domain-containing protein 61-like n=1 Tax=Brachionichthys hirsutus TaxID=412623 RepID=UPI003604BCF4